MQTSLKIISILVIFIDNIVYSNAFGSSCYLRIHVISDNSGYYLISGNGVNAFYIWRYLFSTPTSSQCHQIPFVKYWGYGQTRITVF